MLKLLILTLFTSSVYAQVFTADILNNEERIMEDETYVILNHSTSNWDRRSSSKDGVKKLLDFAFHEAFPTIATVHGKALTTPSEAEKYFFKQNEVSYVLNSEAGQHRLSFPNVTKIYLAGGNLSLCLCETIRDVIRGSRIQKRLPFEVIMVKDAIYDWDPDLDPVQLKYLDQFISSFYVPNFRCPSQNWYGFSDLNLRGIKLSVYFDGTFFKDYDLDPEDDLPLQKLNRTIVVKFLNSERLHETVR